MHGSEPGADGCGETHPNAWALGEPALRAGVDVGAEDGSATWAEPELAGWLSPTPGVFRRACVPEGLGVLRGAARVAAPQLDAPSSGRRAGGGLWRVAGVAVVAVVVVILGLARVTGTGHGAGAVPVDWQPSGSSGPTAEPRSSSRAASGGSGTAAAAVPAESIAPSAHPREPDWWTVLAGLDHRRAVALAATDPALLGDYAQPGSPAWESDEALVSDLSARGLRPEGLSTHVLAIERVERDGPRVTIWAVDRRSGYALVDDRGEKVQAVEPGLPSRWAITLAHVAPVRATPDAAGQDEPGPTPSAVTDPADRGPRPVDPASDPGWRVVEVVPSE